MLVLVSLVSYSYPDVKPMTKWVYPTLDDAHAGHTADVCLILSYGQM